MQNGIFVSNPVIAHAKLISDICSVKVLVQGGLPCGSAELGLTRPL